MVGSKVATEEWDGWVNQGVENWEMQETGVGASEVPSGEMGKVQELSHKETEDRGC